jgi:glycosyltransferase involved in cell wall biosynthesis
MAKRLKVLMSAYACEPGKGSEPEVGWQWALQMARYHDVTVLTRSNNRRLIEPALEAMRDRQPLPHFVYHDRGATLLNFKRQFKAIKIYYLLWQKSAWEVIHSLHQVHQYDLMHHVTFAAFRYPVAIWGHGVPTVWGPVGGIESIPGALLPWRHLRSLAKELTRNAHNLLQAMPFHVLPRRARATTLILVSTSEMQRVFARLGFETQLMPTIGLNTAELPYQPHRRSGGPLKLLFVGNIITLKGIDLAIEALKASGADATFTLVGSGNYLAAAQAQAAKLGLGDQVFFPGRLPREQVLKIYPDYDVFVFPSLHDTGGYAVIEAMHNELPVICLDCGGPAVAVSERCGIKVPLGPRAGVVAGLAAAIRGYAQNRALLAEHGRAARGRILRQYDWASKGRQMDECYQATANRARDQLAHKPSHARYSGMDATTNLLHQMFSFRGVAASLMVLLLIGAVGFLSLGHLKKVANEIVSDTLPGLSYAGEANVTLAQAFNRSLLLMMTDRPERRAELRAEIEHYNTQTTNYLAAYKSQIFARDEQALFDALLQRRVEYLAIRERTFALAESNQRQQALELCQTELFPAYQRYKEAGDKLFEYNMREGTERGRNIMGVCTTTRVIVAGIGIFIFIVGFFIGMFK